MKVFDDMVNAIRNSNLYREEWRKIKGYRQSRSGFTTNLRPNKRTRLIKASKKY